VERTGRSLGNGEGSPLSKVSRNRRVWRYQPDLSPSANLAYVAGFYLGDGRAAGNENKVRFQLSDRVQLQYVGGLVARILERPDKHFTRNGPFYAVDYDSVVLSKFLSKSALQLADYFRGFFDAEGYVTWRVSMVRKSVGGFCVGAANTEMEYLHLVKRMLEVLGIESFLRRTNEAGTKMRIRGRTWIRRHDVYHVVIGRRASLDRFHLLIGFHNRVKAQKLRDAIRMGNMVANVRFAWLLARYEKKGRRWVVTESERVVSRGSEPQRPRRF